MTARKARVELREAIEQYALAVSNEQTAEDMLQKVQTLCASLEEQAAELSTLDETIARERAQQVKLALVAGEHPFFEEPEGFAAAKMKKEHIESELRATREAIGVFEEDLATAKEAVTQKDFEKEQCAEAVIIAEAQDMAANFLKKLTDMRKTHYILSSLANKYVKRDPNKRVVNSIGGQLYGSGGMRKAAMPAIVMDAASQDILGNSEQSGGLWVRDAVTKAVNVYWQALKEDSSASLADEPARDEQHEAAE